MRDAPPRADSPAYLYAVIYTAEQRNGQLVVVELGPDALLNATADSSGVRSAPNPGDGAAEANSTSAAGDGDGVSDSESSGGGEDVEQGGSGGGGTEASHSYWALLQAHSREVELVDITGTLREALANALIAFMLLPAVACSDQLPPQHVSWLLMAGAVSVRVRRAQWSSSAKGCRKA